MAKPLNTLVSGNNTNHKKAPIEWTDECQVMFDKLKELCTSTHILAYANYKKPFQLHTDGSDFSLGAVPYQRDDNDHQRVIAFASRSLSNTEKNYPVHKLEFLALKWAITDRFYEYLYGGQFDVYTDNNPLTYMSCISKTACFSVNCAPLSLQFGQNEELKGSNRSHPSEYDNRTPPSKLEAAPFSCAKPQPIRGFPAIEPTTF